MKFCQQKYWFEPALLRRSCIPFAGATGQSTGFTAESEYAMTRARGVKLCILKLFRFEGWNLEKLLQNSGNLTNKRSVLL